MMSGFSEIVLIIRWALLTHFDVIEYLKMYLSSKFLGKYLCYQKMFKMSLLEMKVSVKK